MRGVAAATRVRFPATVLMLARLGTLLCCSLRKCKIRLQAASRPSGNSVLQLRSSTVPTNLLCHCCKIFIPVPWLNIVTHGQGHSPSRRLARGSLRGATCFRTCVSNALSFALLVAPQCKAVGAELVRKAVEGFPIC